jgi:hypothetical protein
MAIVGSLLRLPQNRSKSGAALSFPIVAIVTARLRSIPTSQSLLFRSCAATRRVVRMRALLVGA